MTPADAKRALHDCCGSSAWADAVSRQLPVRDDAELYAMADRVWWSLCAGDWMEAFRAHPRIGVRAAAGERGPGRDARSASWSAQEQATADLASPDARSALAEANKVYEARFGHIFLICASGKSADQIVHEIHARLGNSAEQELVVAAEEQRRITRLRLARLLAS